MVKDVCFFFFFLSDQMWVGLQYFFLTSNTGMEEQGDAARALSSLYCGVGSKPGVDAICRSSFLLVLSLAPRGFFSCYFSACIGMA